jgi:putative hemolysin
VTKIANKTFGNKIRVAAYLQPNVYELLRKEQAVTGESESAIMCSIIEEYLRMGGMFGNESEKQTV